MKILLALVLAIAACAASAQSGSGTTVTGTQKAFFSSNGYIEFDFNCVGEPTCTGTFAFTFVGLPNCPNNFGFQGTIIVGGLNLGQSGSFSGNITLTTNAVYNTAAYQTTCTFATGPSTTTVDTYSGGWNGQSGSLSMTSHNGPIFTGAPVTFTAQRSSIPPPAPVFPVTVTGGITNGVANVQAAIEFRPQDVGQAGNVYVFALAPPAIVKDARQTALDPPLPHTTASGAKDAPVQCVLAQLSATGQLTGVTASSLQAAIATTLSSAGATVSVLNNVPATAVAGAVMYVGYGSSSSAMINNGINRSVITVPGPQVCAPHAPEAGWWWNANEPGRGFSIETQGNHLFMAGYLYDTSGRSTWVVSGGLTSLDGSLYNGLLQTFSGGQTLTGAYKAPNAPGTVGAITLAFSDATHGTLIWPGGSIPVTRFAIAPPLTGSPPAFVPETGWWWGPSESGRGYFMEFLGATAFIAGYMYDNGGNPLWYLGNGTMTTPQTFSGSWAQYGNGQTLTGAYKPAAQVSANVGSMGLQFTSSSSATLTLPDGHTVALQRFPF